MLYPKMIVRPDDVIRSGIIQPFGVRATDPVAYARHEINPFVSAIRPHGTEAGGVTMVSGSLGITTAENMPLYGNGVSFSLSSASLKLGIAGALLGAAAGYFFLLR